MHTDSRRFSYSVSTLRSNPQALWLEYMAPFCVVTSSKQHYFRFHHPTVLLPTISSVSKSFGIGRTDDDNEHSYGCLRCIGKAEALGITTHSQ